MRLIITDHARERALLRIPKGDLRTFVTAIADADLPLGQKWAIRVEAGTRTLGYAVGERGVWKTTLSSGQTPQGTVHRVRVRA